MELKSVPPTLQRQPSMNSKRPILVPQKTNLKFDLNDLEGLNSNNGNAPDLEAISQARELKPKLSNRKLPSGKLQPLEDHRSTSGGDINNSRTDTALFPEAVIYSAQSKLYIDKNDAKREEEQQNHYIEQFLEDAPVVNLSKEDSAIMRARVIEEMYRIQARSQITPEERKQLYQLAMTMDAPKLARKIVADVKDNKIVESAGPFLTNDYLDSEPPSETEIIEDDDVGSVISGISHHSGVHSIDGQKRKSIRHPPTSAISRQLTSAVDDDELFCKAFDEVERIRKRMLQRASNASVNIPSSPIPDSAMKKKTILDLPIQEKDANIPRQLSPRAFLSPRSSSASKYFQGPSANTGTSTVSSISSSLFATQQDQVQHKNYSRSSNTNTFNTAVPSIQPPNQVNDSTVGPAPLSRTPEDARLRAPMPSDVREALDDLIGSVTPLTGRSQDSGVELSRKNSNVKKSLRMSTGGVPLGSSNSSVGSKESAPDANNPRKGKKDQKQQKENAQPPMHHAFSFHDPFLKPKDERHRKPSEEQLKRMKSVDHNLQMIHRQFSGYINDGDNGNDSNDRYASPIKIATGLQPAQPTETEENDDLDDLITGDYMNKISTDANMMVPAVNFNSIVSSNNIPKKNLVVSTKEDFDNLSATGFNQTKRNMVNGEGNDHLRSLKSVPSAQTTTPTVSSNNPTPMVNPTATMRHRLVSNQNQYQNGTKTIRRSTASPLDDWMTIGKTLDSTDHHNIHMPPPLTSESDVSAASTSHTIMDDSPGGPTSPSKKLLAKRDPRRFSFENEDIERHNSIAPNQSIRKNPVLLTSLEVLKYQNSPLYSGIAGGFGEDSGAVDGHHHHHPRKEVIQNVKRTLHTLQENIARASLSPMNRTGGNQGFTMSFQSGNGTNTFSSTNYQTMTASQRNNGGFITPSGISIGGFTRQSSESEIHPDYPSQLEMDVKRNDGDEANLMRPATTSSVPANGAITRNGSVVDQVQLSRNASNRDQKQLISQSMMIDATTAAAISEEMNYQRPYSQPIYKPPLITRQPSNLAVGIASAASLASKSPTPGSSSKENGGRLSALRNAGGFLLTRENSKTDSPASVLQKSSFAPTAAAANAKDSSSRMYALAAALDAGDAVGKLMADMVISSKNKK